MFLNQKFGDVFLLFFFFFTMITQLICSLLNHPNDYLFIRLVLTAHNPPLESHWPHVNYFVNPHISFNCFGFVYPGDQIELGEIVGGCQHGSARKTDECMSNSLTIVNHFEAHWTWTMT